MTPRVAIAHIRAIRALQTLRGSSARAAASPRTRRRKHGLVQGAKGHASLANLASCGHGYPAIATITSPNHIVPYNNPRAPLLKNRGEGMQVRADKRGGDRVRDSRADPRAESETGRRDRWCDFRERAVPNAKLKIVSPGELKNRLAWRARKSLRLAK